MSTIKPLVYDAANARLAEQAVVIPPGYIDGLNLVWNSGTSISVTSGSAYIEGAASVVNVPAALTLAGLSLSASTWYHVYLYINAGVPAIECVTAAPATAYSGTARSKTGDASRRYLGSIATDTSASLLPFYNYGNTIRYRNIIQGSPYRVLWGGTAVSATPIDLSAAVPATAISVSLKCNNSMTTSGTPEVLNIGATSDSYQVKLQPNGSASISFADVALSPGSTTVYYLYSAPPSQGGGIIDILGFNIER